MVRLTGAAVIWHDVENGSYDADLPLWRELAAAAAGPILDLGAGTGRVALDLAAHGYGVVALDNDPELLAELAERQPAITTLQADARGFALDTQFDLILAPMQLVQILGGREGRLAMLESVHAHLPAGGVFAAALSDPHEAIPSGADSPPLPDILERDGWVFSSQPLAVREQDGRVLIDRRRQSVSPTGELDAEDAQIVLDLLTVGEFEGELREVGLEPSQHRRIAETLDHIGSTVVLCRR